MEEYECPQCDYSGESFSGFAVHCSLNDDHNESKILRNYTIDLIESLYPEKEKAPKAYKFYDDSEVSGQFVCKWFDGYEELVEQSHLRSSQLTERDLTEDIKRVASIIDKTPKKKDYDKHGKYDSSSMTYVIGSWNNALEKAGFDILSYRNISEEKLKEELHRVAEELGRKPTSRDIENKGKFAVNTYLRRFGSWNEALKSCSFEENPQHFDSGQDNIMYNIGKEHPLYGKRQEEHPAWNGGHTKYKGDWCSKRKKALERAENSCEHPDCDKTVCDNGYSLNCHHIIPNKLTDDELKHDLDNLLILCGEHHREIEPSKEYLKPMD